MASRSFAMYSFTCTHCHTSHSSHVTYTSLITHHIAHTHHTFITLTRHLHVSHSHITSHHTLTHHTHITITHHLAHSHITHTPHTSLITHTHHTHTHTSHAQTLLTIMNMMVLGTVSRTFLLTMEKYESTRLRIVSTCLSSCGSMESCSWFC